MPEARLEIAFLRDQPEGAIRISLVQASEVRVRELGGGTAYLIDPARLVVDNRGDSASYEILLPRTLPHVRVRIGGGVVFEKEGSAISSEGSVESGGAHVVPFGAGRAGAR